jgi:hypothetical protein
MVAWRVLARGDHGVGVSSCPEGHIHVELARGEFTLRFDDRHFLAFARTVAAAATKVAKRDRMIAPWGQGDDGTLIEN